MEVNKNIPKKMRLNIYQQGFQQPFQAQSKVNSHSLNHTSTLSLVKHNIIVNSPGTCNGKLSSKMYFSNQGHITKSQTRKTGEHKVRL